MSIEPLRERLTAILAAPPELVAYERWRAARRREAGEPRDYLFTEERVRFEPRREDVAVPLPGLEATERDGAVWLEAPGGGIARPVAGLALADAVRILGAIDGRRSLLEARFRAGVDPSAFGRFLRAAFGVLIFAPRSVEALEARLSFVEVVRFPGSPYAVDRSYWENMADVRGHFEAHRAALDGPDALLRLLRELHVVALLGASLESFYQPPSPGAEHDVAPGALLHAPPRVLSGSDGGLLFLHGARVHAALVGGEPYHRALASDLGDPGALDRDGELQDLGLPWGRVVLARSERDERAEAWFLPPRPVERGHLQALDDALRDALRAADDGDLEGTVSAAARFHQRMVRLHPFGCANQSLAMNLVNAALRRACGAGMPHLVLDLLALRLAPPAYQAAFGRAARAFVVVEPDPARRRAELVGRLRRAHAVIGRVAACSTPAEVEAVVAADGEGARLALLRA